MCLSGKNISSYTFMIDSFFICFICHYCHYFSESAKPLSFDAVHLFSNFGNNFQGFLCSVCISQEVTSVGLHCLFRIFLLGHGQNQGHILFISRADPAYPKFNLCSTLLSPCMITPTIKIVNICHLSSTVLGLGRCKITKTWLSP